MQFEIASCSARLHDPDSTEYSKNASPSPQRIAQHLLRLWGKS